MSDVHPFLREPERARAFELITTSPGSTLRAWAELLSWTLSRVQRFVNTLEREGLAIVERSRWGTFVRPIQPDTQPIQRRSSKPIRTRFGADTEPIRLGSKALDQLPRTRAGSDYNADLIDALNGALLARFGEHHRPVLYDNRSSNATGARLKKAGIDGVWAATELWHQVQLFHPEKHGKGQLPRSLAYFEKSLVKKWTEREQLVAPRLMTTVERGGRREPTSISDVVTQVSAKLGVG